jgi:hypothetical protein
MKPENITSNQGNDQGRLQFLRLVFPTELDQISKRRGLYKTEYKKIDLFKVDLEAVEDAEKELIQASKKVKGLTGIRSVYHRIRLSLPFKKENFNTYAKNCRTNYIETGKKLDKKIEKLQPSVRQKLIGLAFSGGGIRSATFNLGVLQALAKNNFLKYVDYLSTVSGGGYIGSCLSSMFNVETADTDWNQFPFRHIPGKEEPDAIKELRNGSTYLAPDGFFDKIRIPALLLRGILINFLVFLPYIIFAVWLTGWVYGDKLISVDQKANYIITEKSLNRLESENFPDDILKCLKYKVGNKIKKENDCFARFTKNFEPQQRDALFGKIRKHAKKSFDWRSFYKVTKWAALAFLGWVLLFSPLQWILSRLGKQYRWSWRNWYGRSFGILLVAAFGVAFIESMPVALMYLKLHWWDHASGDFWTLLTSLLALIPYVFAIKASKNVSKWTGKAAIAVIGLLGPIIFLMIYLRLSYWSVFFPDQKYFTLQWSTIYWSALALLALVYIMVDVNKTSLHAFYRDRLSKAYLFQVHPAYKITARTINRLKQKGFSDSILEALQTKLDKKFKNKRKFDKFVKKILAGQKSDTDVKSLYTESKVPASESIEHNDTQKLHRLNSEESRAPYHLLNVALNLQNSDDRNLRGRNSDFFIFSKHFTGCERTGFCKTEELEKADHHLDLGTAMAISGAAASPNMGTITIRPLAFIMTLLNIRLGYWMPNPRYVTSSAVKSNPLSGVGPIYLIWELLSRLCEHSRYVNVSDGGHIENTGIYELLRRRCKFIVACDAEADPEMYFGGLAKLIRYARIDMGIDIDIELEDARRQADGLSSKHCALGAIQYGPGETGYLLYIKSSLSGDENEYIHQYRADNPSFPHESTANQFFSEGQFEVYRALGYHIANELFQKRSDNNVELNDIKKIESWFEKIKTDLRPRYQMEESFIDLQNHLTDIENQFKDPAVHSYTLQIYPEIAPKYARKDTVLRIDKEQSRKIFHLCNQQMQLMENVFIALQLDNLRNREHHFNRGWMNLFRRWSQAPYFRRAWAVSIGNYCVGFQNFCEEALRLKSEITWSRAHEKDLTFREKKYLEKEKANKRFKTADTIKKSKKQKAPDEIWQAKMGVLDPAGKIIETFPVGFATLCISKKNIDLKFYRIRDYYREMSLLDKMIPALTDIYPRGYKYRIDFGDRPEEKDRYTHFFERHGFKVIVGRKGNK